MARAYAENIIQQGIAYIRLGQIYSCLRDKELRKNKFVKYEILLKNIVENGGDLDYVVPMSSFAGLYKPEFLGFTALHFAVSTCNLPGLIALLELGADFTIKADNSFTPLRFAVEKGTSNNDKKCWDIKGDLKNSFAEVILNRHVATKNSINPKCNKGISHLHIACMLNNTEVVELFLKSGVSANETVNLDSDVAAVFTPLHFAAVYCSVETVKVLLDHGAERHPKDAKGMTPLHHLVELKFSLVLKKCSSQAYLREMEQIDSLIELLTSSTREKLSDPIDDTGLTKLHILCMADDTDIIEDNVKDLEDINVTINYDSPIWAGYTPLHVAAHSYRETFVLLLDKCKSIVAAKDARGVTAFEIFLQNTYTSNKKLRLLVKSDFFRSIKFTDNTKLAAAIVAYLKYSDKFRDFQSFLETKPEMNSCIEPSSPILPGYTLFHLVIRLTKRVEDKKDHECPPYHFIGARMNMNECYRERKKPKLFVEEICRPQLLRNTRVRLGNSFYRCHRPEMYRAPRFKPQELPPNGALPPRDVLTLCIENGADCTIADINGITPLYFALQLHDKYNDPSYHRTSIEYARHDLLCKLLIEHIDRADEITIRSLFAISVCENNNFKFIRECLNARIDANDPLKVNERWCKTEIVAGSTPLHVAAQSGYVNMIELMLRYGADPIIKNENELTPMQLAFAYDNKKQISLLLRHLRLKKNVMLDGVSNFLMACYASTHFNASESHITLIENYLNIGANVNSRLDWGVTDVKIENLSLPKNSSDDQIVKYRSQLSEYGGYTALHFAVLNKDLELIKLLVSHGADVNAKDNKGLTPLHMELQNAVYEKKRDIVKYFCEKLVDEDDTFDDGTGLTLLHIACAMLDVQMVEDLVNSGSDVNAQIHADSPVLPEFTPLHVITAIDYDRDEYKRIKIITNFLMLNGADITIKNSMNETPIFHTYVPDNESNAINILMTNQKNYESNPTDNEGLSHFQVACQYQSTEVIENYLRHGVDVNQTTDYFSYDHPGYTPLHFAMHFNGMVEVVELLLKYGADVNAKDAHGSTPLHIGFSYFDKSDNQSKKIKLLLRNDEIDVNSRNLFGRIPAELLKSLNKPERRVTENCMDILKQMILKGLRVNALNPVISESVMGTILLNFLHFDLECSTPTILTEAIDLNFIAESSGRNIINDLVAANALDHLEHFYSRNIPDVYILTILQLERIGCNFEYKNHKGQTALHIATEYDNVHAAKALLMLGADINAVDSMKKTALDYCIKSSNYAIKKEFARHIFKMKLYGIYVSDANTNLYNSFLKLISYGDVESLSTQFQISNYRYTLDETIKLRDFLSEKIVSNYAMMTLSKRQVIDECFKDFECSLLEFLPQKFKKHYGCEVFKKTFLINVSGSLKWYAACPDLVGLISLQYRRALRRANLIDPTKNVLEILGGFGLPDPCTNKIIQLLSTDDLSNVVESFPEFNLN